jgi:hypothetical protein
MHATVHGSREEGDGRLHACMHAAGAARVGPPATWLVEALTGRRPIDQARPQSERRRRARCAANHAAVCVRSILQFYLKTACVIPPLISLESVYESRFFQCACRRPRTYVRTLSGSRVAARAQSHS